MPINVVITGSGGMLGSTILEKMAINSKYRVFAVTSQIKKVTSKYSDNTNVQVYSNVNEIPRGFNYIVINCAFPRSNNGKDLAASFDYIEGLIDGLSDKSIRHFINISSQSVYSQFGEEIQTEESDIVPTSLYALAKYSVEHLVKLKCQVLNINFTNIRLGSLFSVDFEQRMINRFCKMISSQEIITVNQGSPRVSYLHVEDAANALMLLIDSISNNYKVALTYNLANNDWMFIKELADECNNIAKKNNLNATKIVYSEEISEYNNVVNSNLFYKDLHWEPSYTMVNLVEEIFKNN